MVLGWAIAQSEDINSHKVLEMLLVHDFVMAKMEDVSPTLGKYSGKYETKENLENEVKLEVIELLPEELKQNYLNCSMNFKARKLKNQILLLRQIN